MTYATLALSAACSLLDEHLRTNKRPLNAVGMGKADDGSDVIYVYMVNYDAYTQIRLKDGWLGYPVKIVLIGNVIITGE